MKRAMAFAGMMLALVGICQAQQAEQYGKGFLPAGSYDFSQIGAVNLLNGNLVLNVPLLSYKQRGSLPDLNINLISNTTTWIWYAGENGDGSETYLWIPLTNSGLQADGGPLAWNTTGMNYAVSGMYTDIPYSFPIGFGEVGGLYGTYDIVYDQYGTPHMAGNGETVDGTGLKSSGVGQVWDKQGVEYAPFYCGTVSDEGICTQTAGVIEDPSNNQIQFDYGPGTTGEPSMLIDSLGRQIPFFDTEDLSAGCLTMEFPGPQSGQVPLTVCRSPHALRTDLDPTIPDGPPTGEYMGTSYLMDSVQVPNGKQWTFLYDNYGNITSIGFPTGGSVSFQWQTVADCAVPTSRDSQVVSRTVSDGTNSYT
jgi:YD repeat-containing protein